MFPINNISENSFVTTSNVSVNIEDIFSDFTEGNLLKKCRLCFNSVESEYKLTKITKHYKSLISNMLEIQFIPTSRTSDFLCQSCVFNIRNFYRFKIKMREKQLSLKNFLIFNNELTKSNESNSTNDSNSVFIKTEPEEIPSVLSPPTAELFSESLLNDHPFEGEFKTESPSDETTGNGINSASDKRHSIDLSKIFPSNEKYQRIIGVCLENPHYSVNMISNLIGIPRSTVGFVIRKYKSIASNNDQLRENCEYSASQIYEDLSRDEQYYIAKELKIENFKCDDCDESFCTRNQVKQHSLVHHIKPKPDSSDAMPKHEKVHMLKNEIKSASDNKKMVDPSEIFPGNANHQRIVDVYLKNPFLSERKVEKLVGFSRGTVRRVIRKYKSITSNNEQTDESSQYYACEICGKLLKGKHSYNNHINLIHEKKKFRQCDICDRRFINKTDLKLHMKVHIPKEFRIKNLQCDHCDKSYDTKQNLKRHLIANHLKFKLHSCNLCEKSFHSEKSLKLHHVSHNKRNVQCDYPDCEKMFKSNKYMLRHKKVHMKELQVKCPYEDCNKSYAKKENLDLHIFVNHKKIREKCPVGNGCKFSVGRRDYMRAHLKKHSELSAGELEKYFKQLSTMNLYSK